MGYGLVSLVVIGMAIGVMGGIGLALEYGGNFNIGFFEAWAALVLGVVMYFGGFICAGVLEERKKKKTA